MRISDWSSDVCSSDRCGGLAGRHVQNLQEVGGRHHAEVDVPSAPTRPASLVQSVEPLAAHPLATPCRPVKQASVAAGSLDLDADGLLVREHQIVWVVDAVHPAHNQIGRASGRDRVCQYVSISVVGVSLTKKK